MSAAVTADDGRMSLVEHLRELRNRFLASAIAIVVVSAVAFAQWDAVQGFLLDYYREAARQSDLKFANFGPLEGFSTRTRISAYLGLFGASPVWLWQLWRFIVPALKEKEKRYAIPFLVSSVTLFIGGAVVALITIPNGLRFLVTFAGSGSEPVWSMNQMSDFVVKVVVAFGFAFLFPVVLVFLQLVRVLSSRQLFRQWRYAIVGIFALAALLTPSQDPQTLAAMALPMTVFYFGSAVLGRLLRR
jgi:sec-independent protein translocase protein TatC